MAGINPTDYAVYDRVVAAMLTGRNDIEVMRCGNYRLIL